MKLKFSSPFQFTSNRLFEIELTKLKIGKKWQFFRQIDAFSEVRKFGKLTERFGRTCSAEIDRRFGRTVRVRSYTNLGY